MAKIKLKQGIDKVIRDLKIYFRLNFIYPASEKNKKIKSILPSSITYVGDNVVVEEHVHFGKFINRLETGLYIGDRTIISFCTKIGKYTSISYDVKIGLVAHPLDFISTSPLLYAKRRGWVDQNLYNENASGFTEIGHDVLISANAVILSGVKIGNGAVIGAGAFVNKDVPPYAVVGGVPANIIRYRFPEEMINAIEKIKWWEMTKDELLRRSDDFSNVKEFIKKI